LAKLNELLNVYTSSGLFVHQTFDSFRRWAVGVEVVWDVSAEKDVVVWLFALLYLLTLRRDEERLGGGSLEKLLFSRFVVDYRKSSLLAWVSLL